MNDLPFSEPVDIQELMPTQDSDWAISDINVPECPESCEIKQAFLDGPSIITAYNAFLLSYDKLDKSHLESKARFKAIALEINEAVEKGEFYINLPYQLEHTICKYLFDLGYKIYVDNYTEISWEKSFINGN